MADTPTGGGNFINTLFSKLFSGQIKAQASPDNAAQSPSQRFAYENNWKRPQNGAGAKSSPALPGSARPVRAGAAPPSALISTDSISSDTSTQQSSSSALSTSVDSNSGSRRNSSDLSSVGSAPSTPHTTRLGTPGQPIDPKTRKFKRLLEDQPDTCDIESLTKVSWNGITPQYRGLVWRLLLGYTPIHPARRESTVERKRDEYRQLLQRYYSDITTTNLTEEYQSSSTPHEKSLLHQIKIDIPRTFPYNKLLQQALERILFIWALRHPASSYVQGINDLVVPFFDVFLKEAIAKATGTTVADVNEQSMIDPTPKDASESPEEEEGSDEGLSASDKLSRKKKRLENPGIDASMLDQAAFFNVEADSYWCVTKFIDSIQDNYTFGQPGIQRMIQKLQELLNRLDEGLAGHLEGQGAQLFQFSFRWMNCLLMRELPLHVVVRMWDTYIAEGPQFASLHTYTCAAFLMHFSKPLQELEFQDLMLMLQHLPTEDWKDDEVEPILSQAYMWRELYNTAPSHLKPR